MNYVINPMWFYLMDLLGGLELFLVLLFLALFIGGGYVSFYCIEECNDSDEAIEFINKYVKWGVIILVGIVILICLIPSEETMLKMLVANMITIENIELTKESAMALVSYIVEQVNLMTGRV